MKQRSIRSLLLGVLLTLPAQAQKTPTAEDAIALLEKAETMFREFCNVEGSSRNNANGSVRRVTV